MVKKNGEGEILRCSFCNKDQNDVRKLIAGPTVFICDECVEVCNDIIADDNRFEARGGARSSLPVPVGPINRMFDLVSSISLRQRDCFWISMRL